MNSVFESYDIPRSVARMLGSYIDSATEKSFLQGYIEVDRILEVEEPIGIFYCELYIFFEELFHDRELAMKNAPVLDIEMTFIERIEHEIDELNSQLNEMLCIPFGEMGWIDISKGAREL